MLELVAIPTAPTTPGPYLIITPGFQTTLEFDEYIAAEEFFGRPHRFEDTLAIDEDFALYVTKFVDDLITASELYTSKYLTGFDEYVSVRENTTPLFSLVLDETIATPDAQDFHWLKTVAETMAVFEEFRKPVYRQFDESVGVEERSERMMHTIIADRLGVGDQIVSRYHIKKFLETVTNSDIITKHAQVEFSDVLTDLTDSLINTISKSISDELGYDDAITQEVTKLVLSSLDIVDALGKTAERSIDDVMAVTDRYQRRGIIDTDRGFRGFSSVGSTDESNDDQGGGSTHHTDQGSDGKSEQDSDRAGESFDDAGYEGLTFRDG